MDAQRRQSVVILTQALRYVMSGALAVLTHYFVLILLVEVGEVDETVASAAGFACAVPANYALQHRFVFESTRRHADTFPYYLVITAVTLGLNTGLFWLLSESFALPYLLAQTFTLAVITPINFVLNRLVTFSVVRSSWVEQR